MLHLYIGQSDGTAAPTSLIEYDGYVLSVSLQPRVPSYGIVVVNRWTLEVGEDGRILLIDGWLPIIRERAVPPRFTTEPVVADIRLRPEYDNNRRASYNYDVDEIYYDQRMSLLVLSWSNLPNVRLFRCTANLSVVVDESMLMMGAVVHDVPSFGSS